MGQSEGGQVRGGAQRWHQESRKGQQVSPPRTARHQKKKPTRQAAVQGTIQRKSRRKAIPQRRKPRRPRKMPKRKAKRTRRNPRRTRQQASPPRTARHQKKPRRQTMPG